MKRLRADYKFSFENLTVWQDSVALAKEIYCLTHSFPEVEKYALCSQIQRAIVSVSANIAEGSARMSYKEQARFTEIAFASLLETLNHLILAKEFGYVDEEKYIELRERMYNLANRINALKNSQLRRKENDLK